MTSENARAVAAYHMGRHTRLVVAAPPYAQHWRSMLRYVVLAAVAALAISLAPSTSRAQVLGRIKQQAADKLKEKKKAADDKVVTAAGSIVDTVAEKSARGVDSVVTRGSGALTTAIDRTEQVVAGAFRSGGSEAELAKQLVAGHAVLADVQFGADGSVLPASLGTLRTLAKLLKEGAETWIIESHVSPGPGDQALSDSRARTIKGLLVEEGVDPSRVWARGSGSTRAATTTATPSDRIELVRMQ